MTISLEQSVYSVSEVEGEVEVCAMVTKGKLASNLRVEMIPMAGTAGEHINLLYRNLMQNFTNYCTL